MSPFSYLAILVSLVLALGLTRLLTGVGQLIQAKRRGTEIRLYWIHLLWVATLFLLHTQFWWTLFSVHAKEQWGYLEFLGVLVLPTILYVVAVLLFPDAFRDGTDMKRHFYEQRRGIFLLLAASYLTSMLWSAGQMGGLQEVWSLSYAASITLSVGLTALAAFTRSELYHACLAIATFAMVAGLNLRLTGRSVIG